VLKVALKTLITKNNGDFCLYHSHNGYDIDYCEEFHREVRSIMARGLLRIDTLEENMKV